MVGGKFLFLRSHSDLSFFLCLRFFLGLRRRRFGSRKALKSLLRGYRGDGGVKRRRVSTVRTERETFFILRSLPIFPAAPKKGNLVGFKLRFETGNHHPSIGIIPSDGSGKVVIGVLFLKKFQRSQSSGDRKRGQPTVRLLVVCMPNCGNWVEGS